MISAIHMPGGSFAFRLVGSGLEKVAFFFFLEGEKVGFGGFSSLGRRKGGFCLAGSGVWSSNYTSGSRDRGSNLRLGLQC